MPYHNRSRGDIFNDAPVFTLQDALQLFDIFPMRQQDAAEFIQASVQHCGVAQGLPYVLRTKDLTLLKYKAKSREGKSGCHVYVYNTNYSHEIT